MWRGCPSGTRTHRRDGAGGSGEGGNAMSLTIVELAGIAAAVAAIVGCLIFIANYHRGLKDKAHSDGVTAGTIVTKVDGLETKVDGLETKVDGLETRFDGLETRFDGLETRFDGLETRFDGLETRFDGLETKVDGLETRFDGLTNSVAGLTTEVQNVSKGFASLQFAATSGPKGYVRMSSPQTLTNKGKEVSREIGAKDIAQMLAPAMAKRAQDLSAYKVQELCIGYLLNEFNPGGEIERKIDDFAYRNGVLDSSVKVIVAIELRDILLKSSKRKETA